MGKAAMLMVIASTMVMVGVSSTRFQIAVDMQEAQVGYEQKVLAREAATSFFNILAGKTLADFDGFRIDQSSLIYKDAVMNFSAVGTSSGEVGLAATAYVGDAAHGISATILEKTGGKLDAVTIDGSIGAVKAAGTKFHITGLDTDPGGLLGEAVNGANTHGIRTTIQATEDALRANIADDQITGIGTGDIGTGDIVTGPSGINLNDLYDDIYKHVENNKNNIDIDAKFLTVSQDFTGNDVFGSSENPVFYIVDGDVNLGGTTSGYGVLLVNGNLNVAHGTPRWEGLIYATGVDASGLGGSSEFKGTVDIYGALILRTANFGCGATVEVCDAETSNADLTLDFSINGDVNLIYSSKAIGTVSDVLPSLNSGSKETTYTLGDIREVASQLSRTSTGSSEPVYTSYQTSTTN